MTESYRLPHRSDGLLLALFAMVLYLLAQPAALHDQSLVLLGLPGVPAPVADTPLAALWLWCVEGLRFTGLGLHAAAMTLAAVAVAAASWLTHASARMLGLTRCEALVAAAFVAFTPAAATAATTVHVHAIELCIAAMAIWLASRLARDGRWITAALLGLLLGGAFVASSAGLLLAVAIVPFWLTEAWPRGSDTAIGIAADGDAAALLQAPSQTLRQRLLPMLTVVAIAMATVFACQWQRPPELVPTWDQIVNYDLGTLGNLLVRDAGRSFLPLSLGILAALWSYRWHRRALVVLSLVGIGLLLGSHLTSTLGDNGSFLLPLLPIASLLVARALTRRWAIALVFVAVALSGTKVLLRAEHNAAAAFVDGYQQIAAERTCRIIAGPYRDQAFLLARLAHVSQESVLGLASADVTSTVPQIVAEMLDSVSSGTCLLLTDEAEQALREPEFRVRYPHSAALLKELEAKFVWQRQRAAGFAAAELVAR
ncbi:MAG: hypothetical protein ACI9SE_003290 [Neolewinella sp.]